MKEDKRIKYIKNVINKGQFYSRYLGIQNAKGEYSNLLFSICLRKIFYFII